MNLDLYTIAKIKNPKQKAQAFYSALTPYCQDLALLTHIAYETSWGRYTVPKSNNLFNLLATNTWAGKVASFGGVTPVSFRAYSTPQASIQDFTSMIKRSGRYPGLYESLQLGPQQYLQTLCAVYYTNTSVQSKLLEIYADLKSVPLAHLKRTNEHGNPKH